MEHEQLISDLTAAVREVVLTYTTGHNIPVATAVGVLHMLAYAFTRDAFDAAEDDDDPLIT